MWVLKWAFIQHGFRTTLVPVIFKAKIFVFYFSIDTGWFQYGGIEEVFIRHEFQDSFST